jgi:hypothetical protein
MIETYNFILLPIYLLIFFCIYILGGKTAFIETFINGKFNEPQMTPKGSQVNYHHKVFVYY